MSDLTGMLSVGAGPQGAAGGSMPTTKSKTAPARIGQDTPIWDTEFAERWDAIKNDRPSPPAAPVKRDPRQKTPRR